MPRVLEVIPDEFDIFTHRPFLQCVQSSEQHVLTPLHTLTGATSIEFNCLPYTDKYKDLSSIFLSLKFQLVKSDGTSFTSTNTEQPHLVTNSLYSIFKSVYVKLNGHQVGSVEQHYHYKEWLETSLNYSVETSTSRLTSQLYIPNAETASLKKVSENSKVFDVYGHINVLNVSKLLIPGVSFNIVFNTENSDFFITEDITKTSTTSKLVITDAKLYIRHVTATPDLFLAHEKMLQKGQNAIYEYKSGSLITHNLAKGVSNINIPNFHTGRKPSLIVFGMVKNSDYVGDRKTNPFNFQHFGLKSFNFLINGSPRPITPYEMTIDDSNACYAHVFSKVIESIGLHRADRSNLITYANFISGHFLIVEDLSNSSLGNAEINGPSEEIAIGVSGIFKSALTENVTCFLYYLQSKQFEVNYNRVLENIT